MALTRIHHKHTPCTPQAPEGYGWEEATRITNLSHVLAARCGDGLCEDLEDEVTCPEDYPQDSDHDSHPDPLDNCPFVPNPAQENFDGDPRGDACDCDGVDAGVWQTPGEVRNLRLFHETVIGWTLLSWDPPVEPGAASLVYDTLRSDLPFDFEGPALCLESDDGADLMSEDWAAPPPPGVAVYYVIRAQNGCPVGGTGSVGRDSFDKPRPARDCP